MKYVTILLLLISINLHADPVLDLVNSARLLEGGGELALTSDCEGLARINNELMVDTGTAAHFGGMQLRWEWLRNNNVYYRYFGEIASLHPADATYEALVMTFEESPPHWEVLQMDRYTHISYDILRRDGKTALTIIFLER